MLTRALLTLASVSFFSGINLYAATLTLGLAIRWQWITFPPQLSGLAVLGRGGVLLASGILFGIGFLVEKLPLLDNRWNALHLWLRPAVVLGLAWHALEGHAITPRIASTLICGALALAAAWGQSGAHTFLTALAAVQPEAAVWSFWLRLSLIEDLVTLAGLYASIRLPYLGLGLTTLCLVLIALNAWRVRDAHALLSIRAQSARELETEDRATH